MRQALTRPACAIVFAVVIGDLGRGHPVLRPGEVDKLLQRVADDVLGLGGKLARRCWYLAIGTERWLRRWDRISRPWTRC